MDSVSSPFALNIPLHHSYLPGQINDGDIYQRVVIHTTERKFTRISTHIHQMFRIFGENDFQRLVERMVTIEVIKIEPALQYLRRKLR
jgi:hypothetical protein